MKVLPVFEAPGGQTSITKFASKTATQYEPAETLSRDVR
jgi:hypothetical protein